MVSILFVVLFSLSSVSANDNLTDGIVAMSEDTLTANANNSDMGIEYNDGETLSDGFKTFTDLNDLINSAESNINLDSDYKYNPAYDSGFVNGIVISRQITVYGNGHTIDGNSQARIFNATSYVYFNDLIFINAKSDRGSAIIGSSYAVMNSKFINNVATDSGGAIIGGYALNSVFQSNSASLYGGAAYKSSVDNCTFLDNSASEGGAIYDVYATKSIFERNHADSYGGAMRGSSAKSCTFTQNSAKLYGGAVFDAYLDSCKFFNNTANTGGAIADMSQNSVINCLFEGNSANDGGAVYGYSVFNSIFRNNHANHGGAMYTGSVRSSVFEDNYAIDKGGALMGAYAEESNFTHNHAVSGGAMFQNSAKNCNFVDNSAVQGGAMFNSHANTCKFMKNSANEGGAIYEGGAESSDFRYNYAVNGGAVATSDVLACTFINNTADTYGGAAYKTSARRSYFGNNVAKYGGAVSVASSASECVFKYNVAKITGGAKYDAFIADSEFEGNLPKYILEVSDLSIIEGFGADFRVKLYDSPDYPVTGVNSTIKLYNSKNKVIGTYICECGYSWFVNLPAGKYKAVVSVEDECYEIDPVTVSITVKKSSFIYVVNIVANYDSGKCLLVNLHDSAGKVIKYAKVYITLNGATKYYFTDDNGQVMLSTKGLAPKNYPVTIYYAGDNTYVKSSATAKITINKVNVKIIAAKKTFKKKDKSKVYTVTLKNHKGALMKNTKLTVKVGNKLYSAKTNKKGIATFKFTKLTKKGTFIAVITYAGNAYYKALSKKVAIYVK